MGSPTVIRDFLSGQQREFEQIAEGLKRSHDQLRQAPATQGAEGTENDQTSL